MPAHEARRCARPCSRRLCCRLRQRRRKLLIFVVRKIVTNVRGGRRILRIPHQRLAQRLARLRIARVLLQQFAAFSPRARVVGQNLCPAQSDSASPEDTCPPARADRQSRAAAPLRSPLRSGNTRAHHRPAAGYRRTPAAKSPWPAHTARPARACPPPATATEVFCCVLMPSTRAMLGSSRVERTHLIEIAPPPRRSWPSSFAARAMPASASELLGSHQEHLLPGLLGHIHPAADFQRMCLTQKLHRRRLVGLCAGRQCRRATRRKTQQQTYSPDSNRQNSLHRVSCLPVSFALGRTNTVNRRVFKSLPRFFPMSSGFFGFFT